MGKVKVEKENRQKILRNNLKGKVKETGKGKRRDYGEIRLGKGSLSAPKGRGT